MAILKAITPIKGGLSLFFTITLNSSSSFSAITGISDTISINWGDGSTTSYSAGASVTIAHTYAGVGNYVIKFFAPQSDVMSNFFINTGNVSFSTANIPRSVTAFYVRSANTVSGTVADLPSGLTYIQLYGSNTLSGDVADLPSGLTSLSIFGSNTITGNCSDLPSVLTYIELYGSNTLTGDIAGMPTGITYLDVAGSNTLSGDVVDLPTGITFLTIFGSNTLYGDVADLPSGLTYLNGSTTLSGLIQDLPASVVRATILGNNTCSGDIGLISSSIKFIIIIGFSTINAYTPKVWSNGIETIILTPGGAGLASADVDQLIIDLSSATFAGEKIVTLNGANAARTAASDAAVTSLQAQGVTVTTN